MGVFLLANFCFTAKVRGGGAGTFCQSNLGNGNGNEMNWTEGGEAEKMRSSRNEKGGKG